MGIELGRIATLGDAERAVALQRFQQRIVLLNLTADGLRNESLELAELAAAIEGLEPESAAATDG
jgi:hypothetical protein